MELKYLEQIEHLISLGLELPSLIEPNDKKAYRFIFKNTPDRNHLPVYIMKPQRVLSELKKSNATTSGYALSCYEDMNKAREEFYSLKSRFPKIKVTVGDSLSTGNISNTDGWKQMQI